MIDEKLKNRALNPVCKGDPAPREKILKLGTKVTVYGEAEFTADKGEYLPIPFAQVAASNGYYTQNIGNW